jgi:hypothetical protein
MTQTMLILVLLIFGLIVVGLCIRDIIRVFTGYDKQ